MGRSRRRSTAHRELTDVHRSTERIERALEQLFRRRPFTADEREDFHSWAWIRLLERWDRIVSEFGGRSRFDTYLGRVLNNLLKDYRTAKWGKWRPSSTASAEGLAAMELERLLFGERLEANDAVELVVHRYSHRSQEQRRLREHLWQVAGRLSAKPSNQAVALEPERLEEMVPIERLELPPGLARDANARRARRWLALLVDTLAQVDQAGRDLLRSYFVEGRPYVQTARATGRTSGDVYNQAHRALRKMKRILLRALGERRLQLGLELEGGDSLNDAFDEIDLGVDLQWVFDAAACPRRRAWARRELAS